MPTKTRPRAPRSTRPGRKRAVSVHPPVTWLLQPAATPAVIAAAVAHLERFERFCERISLELEPFERWILLEVFAGRRELLALLPKGNGKTGLFAALALFHLGTTPRAYVPIGASTREQAGLLFDQLRVFAEHPQITADIQVKPGYRAAFCDRLGGQVKVFASEGARAHGPGPTLVLLDELWAHANRRLYTAFRTALGKRGGQLVNLSTIEDDPDGPLGVLRSAALAMPDLTVHQDGYLTVARSEDLAFAMLQWACREGDDLTDPVVLKRANPFSQVTVDWLTEQTHAPGVQPFEVAQFHANIAPKAVAGCWVEPRRWRAAGDADLTIPDGTTITLGLDVGHVWDSTAIQPYWTREDEPNVAAHTTVIEAAGDGTAMRISNILTAFERILDRWDVEGVVIDRWGAGEAIAQTLEDDHGIQIIEWSQQPEPMALAATRLLTAIDARTLLHDANPVLTGHALAAVPVKAGRAWKLGKPELSVRPGGGHRRRGRLIDAVIALAIVNAAAMTPAEPALDRSAYRIEAL